MHSYKAGLQKMSFKSSESQKKLSRRDISRNRLESFKREVVTDAHTIPLGNRLTYNISNITDYHLLDELCHRLHTNQKRGLTNRQAKQILEITGPNALTPSTRTPEIVKFLRTIFQGKLSNSLPFDCDCTYF